MRTIAIALLILVALLVATPGQADAQYAPGQVAGFVTVVDQFGNTFIQPVPFGYTTAHYGPNFRFVPGFGFVHVHHRFLGVNRFGRRVFVDRFGRVRHF